MIGKTLGHCKCLDNIVSQIKIKQHHNVVHI